MTSTISVRPRVLAAVFAVIALSLALAATAVATAGPARSQPSPIQHIIVLDQENHSFDSVFGFWCRTSLRCRFGDAMPSTVTYSDGEVVTPTVDPDIVPSVNHSVNSQLAAMNIVGGVPRMNGWENTVSGCTARYHYRCISGYQPTQIPDLISLATRFAMNDRFFEMKDSPSWGGHLYSVAATMDGFTGDNPVRQAGGPSRGPGWGCDSNLVTRWASGGSFQPSCVPDFALSLRNGGAFEPTKARYVPTIMDRLDAARLSWRIYGATGPGTPGTTSQDGYIWSTCPTFAECLDTSQRNKVVDEGQIIKDAQHGTLPNFGLVTAGGSEVLTSQHNGMSMATGDNWIGQVASAIMMGREWSSTALIITYDDYGGFYDSAPPPTNPSNPDGTQQGLRLPFVLVSPYAKPAFIDSTPASFASILAFVEHNFGLPPLEKTDQSAYPLTNMLNLTATPHLGNQPRMVTRPVPHEHVKIWELRQGT